jgi:DNA-binding MarR family transcriptional regulator
MAVSRAMQQLRGLRFAEKGPRAPWADATHGQGRVLALLKLQPETTQRDLTYVLGMSRQATAELLSKLEVKGLIERQQHAEDRRVVTVKLTDAGIAAAAEQEPDKRGQKPRAFDVLSDAEVTQLIEMLNRVEEQLHLEIGKKVAAHRDHGRHHHGSRRPRRPFGPEHFGPEMPFHPGMPVESMMPFGPRMPFEPAPGGQPGHRRGRRHFRPC